MRKIISVLLCFAVLLCCTACQVQFRKPQAEAAESVINHVKDFADGTANMALVVSPDGLEQNAFNSIVYGGCTGFSSMYNVEFSYYICADKVVANVSDLLRGVIDDGYNVIILPGAFFASSIAEIITDYPEVMFIGVDISGTDFPQNFIIPSNLCCISFREEILGYMAGYAAVSMGYRHLAFLGSKVDEAQQRYGTGFVQGADAGARAQVASVTLEYLFTGTETADAVVDDYLMDLFGETGVQLAFAVGDNTASMAAKAAAAAGTGKVFGADIDRFRQINSYGSDLCISCAEKNYKSALITVLLDLFSNDNWEAHGGKLENYGLDPLVDPQTNYLQLSYYSTKWNDFFTKDDYALLVTSIANEEITIEKSADTLPELYIAINYYDNIK